MIHEYAELQPYETSNDTPSDDLFDNMNKAMIFLAKIVGNSRQGVDVRVIRCYNYAREWHYTKDCKNKKMAKDSKYFKARMLLAKAAETGIDPTNDEHDFLAATLLTTNKHDH
ncbi:hypothetical protein Tco_0888845 [Tanacetum coccineum]